MAKSKWEQVKDKLILIEGWARDGLTDEQIYTKLGIGKTTFYRMQKEHPELLEHLKKGKEIIDYEVENALLRRALGFEYEEKTYRTTVDKETGKQKNTIATITKKYVTPDTKAQIFWLKNREPNKWKDRIENVVNTDEISKVEELLNVIKQEAEK